MTLCFSNEGIKLCRNEKPLINNGADPFFMSGTNGIRTQIMAPLKFLLSEEQPRQYQAKSNAPHGYDKRSPIWSSVTQQ
jgi:hypothetical protein